MTTVSSELMILLATKLSLMINRHYPECHVKILNYHVQNLEMFAWIISSEQWSILLVNFMW